MSCGAWAVSALKKARESHLLSGPLTSTQRIDLSGVHQQNEQRPNHLTTLSKNDPPEFCS